MPGLQTLIQLDSTPGDFNFGALVAPAIVLLLSFVFLVPIAVVGLKKFIACLACIIYEHALIIVIAWLIELSYVAVAGKSQQGTLRIFLCLGAAAVVTSVCKCSIAKIKWQRQRRLSINISAPMQDPAHTTVPVPLTTTDRAEWDCLVPLTSILSLI